MKKALAPVAALLITVSILMAGLGLQGTLLPVRATLETFSTFLIGIIATAHTVSQVYEEEILQQAEDEK